MQKKLKIAIVIIFLALMVLVTVFAARWVISLRDQANLAAFQAWVASLGFGGWLLLFGIQYVQIVVAFVPGGPIQIVAGALFGLWGGLAVCVGGTLLATATVFYLVSHYGHKIISLFVEEKDLGAYKFLNGEKKLERLVLLLFFIPGTPKDALTYIFALTKIRMSRFMLLSTLARIPAIVTSLLAGDSIIEGNWQQAAIMFVVLSAVSLLGFLLQKYLKAKLKRESSGKDKFSGI